MRLQPSPYGLRASMVRLHRTNIAILRYQLSRLYLFISSSSRIDRWAIMRRVLLFSQMPRGGGYVSPTDNISASEKTMYHYLMIMNTSTQASRLPGSREAENFVSSPFAVPRSHLKSCAGSESASNYTSRSNGKNTKHYALYAWDCVRGFLCTDNLSSH